MMSPASVNGGLRLRPVSRARIQRVETPNETPAAGELLACSTVPRLFRDHCEEEFVYLAEQNPAELVRLMKSTLADRPNLLTFAAEAVGRIANAALVVAILLPLLSHADPVVREGAVYGLSPHLGSSLDAREALRDMVKSDPSPGVVDAINDALLLLR